MRTISVLMAASTLATPAVSQSSTSAAQPTVTLGMSSAAAAGNTPVQRLLVEGYEIKTGFSDNSGGAYMVLQKATSAYMCHSNPTPTCEKLN